MLSAIQIVSQQVVDIARQDGEEDHPMIGGEQEDAISDDVRSPITLSPDRSAASEVDGVDVPVITGHPIRVKISGRPGYPRLRRAKQQTEPRNLHKMVVRDLWQKMITGRRSTTQAKDQIHATSWRPTTSASSMPRGYQSGL